MAEIEIYVDEKLLKGISELAAKHYGDDSEASRERVFDLALKMRILWSRSVKEGQQEADEAVTEWESPDPPLTKEDTGTIRDWLFRR